MYDITAPNGHVIKHPQKGWRFSRETFERELGEGKIVFSQDFGRIIRKIYLADQEGRVPESIWFSADAGTTREATAEVADVLGATGEFDTPKPTRLIKRILQIASDKDSLILDSFAGSGTTAHAVLKQNAEDGGNRRFILVEMDDGIARNIAAERVRRVVQGYTNTKGEHVPGLGGGFQYCTLGNPLFDSRGHIGGEVRFAELARFVWFIETGMGLAAGRAKRRAADTASPLLGVHDGRAVYLLYNGILKDRSIDGGNVLTTPLLEHLPIHAGPKVVYGARCAIGADRLRKLGVVFKQLPYHLRVAP